MLLTVDGLQVPVIPFGDVALKFGGRLPEHIEKSLKSGSIGPIEILKEFVFNAQGNNIGSGTKVYVVVPIVEVSTGKGLQVPVIGIVFVEVEGKIGGTTFMQYAVGIRLNVGVTVAEPQETLQVIFCAGTHGCEAEVKVNSTVCPGNKFVTKKCDSFFGLNSIIGTPP
jgi:hypothetical protein